MCKFVLYVWIIGILAIAGTFFCTIYSASSRIDPGNVQGSNLQEARASDDARASGTVSSRDEGARAFRSPYVVLATVTAYSPRETCRGGKIENCRTANGSRTIPSLSIACPRAIPFSSRITIRSQSYRCSDRTSRKYDGRFDVFFANYGEAKQFGKLKREPVLVELPL